MQQEIFAQEIVDVTKGHGVNRHSSLLPLHPVLDSQGLLQVEGRTKFKNVLFKKASSNLAWKTPFDSHDCTS